MNSMAKFHADRRTGVGGSDVGKILGVSPYGTALDVYLEKRGEVAPSEENPAMLWGKLLEPVVRQQYVNLTGREVVVPSDVMRSAAAPYMIAHPDGLVLTEQRGYEGKTARSDHGWGIEGTDQIPMGYILQVQHYMVVTAMPVFDVAVLIGGSDFRMYEVPADAELQAMIVEAEAEFWKRVEAGEPPEPDWNSPATLEAVQRLYGKVNGARRNADESEMAWRRVMEESRAKATEYAAMADQAKAHLLWQMGDAEMLAFPDGKALRRKITGRKAYTVEACEYLDARFVNLKE